MPDISEKIRDISRKIRDISEKTRDIFGKRSKKTEKMSENCYFASDIFSVMTEKNFESLGKCLRH